MKTAQDSPFNWGIDRLYWSQVSMMAKVLFEGGAAPRLRPGA